MITSLHIIGSRDGGGAERFFVRLVEGLDRAGQRATAVIGQGSWVDRQLHAGIERVYVPMRSVWDLPSRWAIRRLVAERRPDIVQTYMGRATRLTHLARPSAPGDPVHVARLGGYYDLKGYRHAHAWIGNTRGIRDYLGGAGLPDGRVFHAPNFIDPPERVEAGRLAALRTQWQLPPAARIVLGVGRLHPNKGFADLLAAFARLPAETEGAPVVLVIVGDGPLGAELRTQAGDLGIAERVRWTGWSDDVTPWYQLADLFVCPSRHEPLGNVILEAWSNRVALVSTATQGATELIRDGHDGLLVPVADGEALATALAALLGDPARRSALAEAGLATVRENFNQARVVRSYLDIYAALSGRPA